MVSRFVGRVALPFVTFVTLILLAGCGTMVTKTNPSGQLPNQLGHAYTGIQFDIIGMKCAFTAPAEVKDESNLRFWGLVAISPLVLAFYIVDFPLSLAADTLLLPLDVFREPTDRRMTFSDAKCLSPSAY